MKKEFILFDLDGTISDSEEGIINSFRYALEFFGVGISAEELRGFLGPPLRDSFMSVLDGGKVEEAVIKYREYFSVKGIYENHLYDGIDDLLEKLYKKGAKILLATSKITRYAEEILRYFNIGRHFAFVAGSDPDGARSKKAEIIRYALENAGAAPERAVMIGDRKYDISGAKEAGVESVGVLYGYGSEEELRKAGADHIAGSVKALSELLQEML